MSQAAKDNCGYYQYLIRTAREQGDMAALAQHIQAADRYVNALKIAGAKYKRELLAMALTLDDTPSLKLFESSLLTLEKKLGRDLPRATTQIWGGELPFTAEEMAAYEQMDLSDQFKLYKQHRALRDDLAQEWGYSEYGDTISITTLMDKKYGSIVLGGGPGMMSSGRFVPPKGPLFQQPPDPFEMSTDELVDLYAEEILGSDAESLALEDCQAALIDELNNVLTDHFLELPPGNETNLQYLLYMYQLMEIEQQPHQGYSLGDWIRDNITDPFKEKYPRFLKAFIDDPVAAYFGYGNGLLDAVIFPIPDFILDNLERGIAATLGVDTLSADDQHLRGWFSDQLWAGLGKIGIGDPRDNQAYDDAQWGGSIAGNVINAFLVVAAFSLHLKAHGLA